MSMAAKAVRRQLKLALIGVGSAWAIESIFLVLDSERGLVTWFQAQRVVQATRADLEGLLAKRDRLQAQRAALQTDRDAIVGAAREELGMVFPGEEVLRFQEEEAEAARP